MIELQLTPGTSVYACPIIGPTGRAHAGPPMEYLIGPDGHAIEQESEWCRRPIAYGPGLLPALRDAHRLGATPAEAIQLANRLISAEQVTP